MILLKEFFGVPFRNDVLRGVRLFLIAFSAVLIGVWVYRMLRAPSDVQGAEQNAPASYEAVTAEQPAPAPAPVAEAASDPRGLVVPPPPPVGGKRANRAIRPHDDDVPPPPPLQVVRASSAPAPSGREFETSEVSALPAAPTVTSPDAGQVPAVKGVGYKSLIEANADRLPVDPGAPAPVEEPAVEKPQKGNRFLRAIGKLFHPNGQKETMPLTLQPKP